MLIAAGTCAALVKFVLRPAFGGTAALVMGPLPDLFTALAISFAWVSLGHRLVWPVRRHLFVSDCLWAWVILLNNELWQLRESNERFDPLDVAASAAGAAIAYFIYRRSFSEGEARS